MKFSPKFIGFSVPPLEARALFIWQVNVDLFDTPTNNLGLQSRLNNPLYSNYQTAANFAMVVISILFILYAFQIYNKMQMGESKLTPVMTRFFLGLVVFLASLSFLNHLAQKQDYHGNSVQNLNLPKLSK